MSSAQIVRVIAHQTNVQVLCADERGLVSVYFDPDPFASFCKLVKRSGLKLPGLPIEFDRESVHVSALGKTCKIYSSPRNSLKTFFTRVFSISRKSL
jgi:hypothetical protein